MALILGFDTSAAHCAAAVVKDGQVLAQAVEPMEKGQAERLMGFMAELLTQAGAGWGDLTAIGVGIGPGNFTGIRLSVAAARGLALARGIPAIGVSGFEALWAGGGDAALASIDARRGKIYLALPETAHPTAPQLYDLATLPEELAGSGLAVLGHGAADIARFTGGAVLAPAFPCAEAIARVAAARCHLPAPRPAPLYLRSPDAAPPSDPPPVILA